MTDWRESLSEALDLLGEVQNILSAADIPGQEWWLDHARNSLVATMAYVTMAQESALAPSCGHQESREGAGSIIKASKTPSETLSRSTESRS